MRDGDGKRWLVETYLVVGRNLLLQTPLISSPIKILIFKKNLGIYSQSHCKVQLKKLL